jgi:hypothetical protein
MTLQNILTDNIEFTSKQLSELWDRFVLGTLNIGWFSIEDLVFTHKLNSKGVE